MPSTPRDTYDQFSDASTTPFWDLAILLTTLAGIAGGGLALVYAIGYLAVGRTSLAWPMLATAAVLLVANLALRYGRRAAVKPTPPLPDRRDERLRSIRPLHFEPDDEGHTREDKERARKDRAADRWPFSG